MFMLTIELTQLIFHGYHGLYEDEKTAGGEFEVNVSIDHHPGKIPVTNLEQTIDYSAVYELIKQSMQRRTYLLETIATKLAQEILLKFSQAEEVRVSIKKAHPPIKAFEGQVAVIFCLKRSELINNS